MWRHTESIQRETTGSLQSSGMNFPNKAWRFWHSRATSLENRNLAPTPRSRSTLANAWMPSSLFSARSTVMGTRPAKFSSFWEDRADYTAQKKASRARCPGISQSSSSQTTERLSSTSTLGQHHARLRHKFRPSYWMIRLLSEAQLHKTAACTALYRSRNSMRRARKRDDGQQWRQLDEWPDHVDEQVFCKKAKPTNDT